jgi:hypothetical protein
VHVGIVGGRVEAAAEDVNLAVGGDRRRMIARLRQRRGVRPLYRRRIEHFVRTDRDAIDAASADRVEFAGEHATPTEPRGPSSTAARATLFFAGSYSNAYGCA